MMNIDVGTGGVLGARPPRFCNKQRSSLFIFSKCPLPQIWDASNVPDDDNIKTGTHSVYGIFLLSFQLTRPADC